MAPGRLAHEGEMRHHRVGLDKRHPKNRGRPDGQDGRQKDRDRLYDEPEIGAKSGPFDETADPDRENQNEGYFERAKRECRRDDAGVPIGAPSAGDGLREKNKARQSAEREELM